MPHTTQRRGALAPAGLCGIGLVLLATAGPLRAQQRPAVRVAAGVPAAESAPDRARRRAVPPRVRLRPAMRAPTPGEIGLHAALRRSTGGDAPDVPEAAEELVRLGQRLFGSRGVLRWGERAGDPRPRVRVGLHAGSPGPGIRAVVLTR